MENKEKHWLTVVGIASLVTLLAFAGIMIYIDPFFHYHKMVDGLAYSLNMGDERYINDGIVRNFEYDGVLVGTSMIENFSCTEAGELWGMNFVKCPKNGSYFKESNDLLVRAYAAGRKPKVVIRSLDYSLTWKKVGSQYIVVGKDDVSQFDYPEYLTNDNILDDVKYLFNKSVFWQNLVPVLNATHKGQTGTTFDDYANWNDMYTYGKDTVVNTYQPYTNGLVQKSYDLTEEDRDKIRQNIEQNVLSIAKEHPETTFYYFFPPYSVCYYETLKNDNVLDVRFDVDEVVISKLVKQPNIRLYSYTDDFDVTTNLDNYKDIAHYGEWINSYILQQMHADKGRITDANYKDYMESVRTFYDTYDYSVIHE